MPTPTPSRRAVLKLLSAGAVAAGYSVVTGSWIGSAAARPATGLRFVPDLDGTLHLDPTTLAAYANDYGQIIHETPVAVLEPGSTRDIRRMLQFARLNRIRVAARGQGHLPFGQAQVSGGLVIDMRTRNAVHEVGPDWVDTPLADNRVIFEHARAAGGTLFHGTRPAP